MADDDEILVNEAEALSKEYMELYHEHVLDGLYKQNKFRQHNQAAHRGPWKFSHMEGKLVFGIGKNEVAYDAEMLGTASKLGDNSWFYADKNPSIPPIVKQLVAQLRKKLSNVREFHYDIQFVTLVNPHVLGMIAIGELDLPAYFSEDAIFLIKDTSFPKFELDIWELRKTIQSVAFSMPEIKLTPELIDTFMKKYDANVVVKGNKRCYTFDNHFSNVFVTFRNDDGRGGIQKIGGMIDPGEFGKDDNHNKNNDDDDQHRPCEENESLTLGVELTSEPAPAGIDIFGDWIDDKEGREKGSSSAKEEEKEKDEVVTSQLSKLELK